MYFRWIDIHCCSVFLCSFWLADASREFQSRGVKCHMLHVEVGALKSFPPCVVCVIQTISVETDEVLPCRAASPHTPHTGSSHPPPGQTCGHTHTHTLWVKGPLEGQKPGAVFWSHLVFWVGVRPAAGAVQPKEVLTVFVQTVDFVLLLQNKVQSSHLWYIWCIVPRRWAHQWEFTLKSWELLVSTVTPEVPAKPKEEAALPSQSVYGIRKVETGSSVQHLLV